MPDSESSIRLTLYVEPSFKRMLAKMALNTRPRTNLSGLGVYLLELGLEKHYNKLNTDKNANKEEGEDDGN